MRTVELIYRYGSRHAQVRPRPQDAASARVRLNDGNRAFAALLDHFDETGGPAQRIVDVDPRDLGLDADHHAPSQHPFAAILGCSDARAPIELLFNEGPNELFVVRVAGNGLGADSLGSLSYAVEHLGESLRLIVILGHSGCGALTAAVDAFLEPNGYLSMAADFALRGIVDRLLPVVDASARHLAQAYGADAASRPGYRHALIETSIAVNAALAAYWARKQFPRAEAKGVGAAYGVYLLETREIWSRPMGPNRASASRAPRGRRGAGGAKRRDRPLGAVRPRPRRLSLAAASGPSVVSATLSEFSHRPRIIRTTKPARPLPAAVGLSNDFTKQREAASRADS
ncbi:carbonic anhydrase [Roseiarcus sp.]|uniref:carbonic anhydrase n=1 Tax=Roseiarcus sp. TaxID=1969460 RepID=UPI003F987DA8